MWAHSAHTETWVSASKPADLVWCKIVWVQSEHIQIQLWCCWGETWWEKTKIPALTQQFCFKNRENNFLPTHQFFIRLNCALALITEVLFAFCEHHQTLLHCFYSVTRKQERSPLYASWWTWIYMKWYEVSCAANGACLNLFVSSDCGVAANVFQTCIAIISFRPIGSAHIYCLVCSRVCWRFITKHGQVKVACWNRYRSAQSWFRKILCMKTLNAVPRSAHGTALCVLG